MIQSTRNWLRRNRGNLAVGAGIVGTAYLAGQYAVGKFSEARQRMGEERIAKDNLRRRFEQNQEDCSFTVLAILPTATDKVIDAIPVEEVLGELQRHKAERLARSVGPSEIASSAPPSVAGGGGGDGHVADAAGGGDGHVAGAADGETNATDDGTRSSVQDSESYVHASQIALDDASQASHTARKSKAQLWNDMKIGSITRAFTLLYTIALLTLLTRIQLNLLGRRNYLASVVSLAAPPPPDAPSRIKLEDNDDNFDHAYGNDFETNRRFLSLSWWLLHRGCLDLIDTVRAAVHDVFGLLNPREEVTMEKLSELVLQVRKRVEGATEDERRTRKWLPYLLPPPDHEDFVLAESGMTSSSQSTSPTTTASLRRLIDETSDIIDSPAFTSVLTRLLDAAFSHLIDVKISTLSYKIPPVSADGARVTEIVGDGAKAKLANSLAVFCRQAHNIGAGANNEYLHKMELVPELEAFAAVVYSSNFEFESPALLETGAGEDSIDKAAETFDSAWDKAVAN